MSDRQGSGPKAVSASGPRIAVSKQALAPGAAGSDAASKALACALRSQRQLRRHHFDKDLFGEPAWDMLLELYCRSEEGIGIPIGTVIKAAGVPHATAVRWMRVLESRAMVRSTNAQAPLVRLTTSGRHRMQRYLEGIARG